MQTEPNAALGQEEVNFDAESGFQVLGLEQLDQTIHVMQTLRQL